VCAEAKKGFDEVPSERREPKKESKHHCITHFVRVKGRSYFYLSFFVIACVFIFAASQALPKSHLSTDHRHAHSCRSHIHNNQGQGANGE